MLTKKLNTVLLSSALLSISMPTSAFDFDRDLCFKPYVAYDYGISRTKFETGFGGGRFKKSQPKSNYSVGIKLHDYFGIEFGYETTNVGTNDIQLISGNSNLGITLAAPSATYAFRSKYKGYHGNLIGYLPIECHFNLENKLSLYALVGVSRLKANLTRQRFLNSGTSDPETRQLNDNNRKSVLRLGIGVESMLTKHFGVRLQAIHLNSSKLKPSNTESNTITAKLKDTYSYSIGFIASF